MENFYEYEEEFRNSIATVDERGKRIWVYPKSRAENSTMHVPSLL